MYKAPGELYLHNASGTGSNSFLSAAYGTTGSLQRHDDKKSAGDVAAWLLR